MMTAMVVKRRYASKLFVTAYPRFVFAVCTHKNLFNCVFLLLELGKYAAYLELCDWRTNGGTDAELDIYMEVINSSDALKLWPFIWAPSSDFVSSSIPS